MEIQYTKIDDKTMEVVTPTTEVINIDEQKRVRKDKLEQISQSQAFIAQLQGDVDRIDSLLTQAESIGLVIE